MLKSGKEQTLRSQSMLLPSLQGSGGDFNVPVVWKTFLVTMSLDLKHQAPLGVDEMGWESPTPSCYIRKGKPSPEKAFGKAPAHP